MKKRILTQFVTATAGLVLPLSLVAQDYSDQTSSGSPDESATTSGAIDQSSGSHSSGGALPGGHSPSLQNQPGTFSGGIMVHDGAAYIVHRLQNEMSLPDGSKVQPNGTIRESDGSTRSIGTGKVLTLDGREMEAPFKSEQDAPSSSAPGMSNPSSQPGSSSSMPETQSSPSSPNMPPAINTPSQDPDASDSIPGQPESESSSSSDSSSQNSGSGLAPGSVSTKDGTELH